MQALAMLELAWGTSLLWLLVLKEWGRSLSLLLCKHRLVLCLLLLARGYPLYHLLLHMLRLGTLTISSLPCRLLAMRLGFT